MDREAVSDDGFLSVEKIGYHLVRSNVSVSNVAHVHEDSDTTRTYFKSIILK